MRLVMAPGRAPQRTSLLRSLVVLLWAIPLLACGAPPSFSLTDLHGRTHTLAAYRGKWVLVNLWATWCPPCLAEMPELEILSRSRDDLAVLGVAVDGDNAKRVAMFAEKLKVTYPIVAGNDELAATFEARGYPTSILYGPSGEVALVKEGAVTRKEVEKALARASPPVN